MREKLLKRKSHMEWSWVLMFVFLALTIWKSYFGILGFVCMMLPLYHSLKGEGRVNCSHFCPRGSFLMRFLEKISLNNNLPKFFRTKKFKNFMFLFMMTMFSISIYGARGSLSSIGFIIFRFIVVSSIVAIILGIIFKPRSWCQVCPMGHLSGEIAAKKNWKTIAIKKELAAKKG